MKALEKIREISKTLASCGIEAAEKEAELFITHRLNMDLVDLYKNNPDLIDKQTRDIDEMVARRSRREPLQYILGYCNFSGLKILVGSGVLIPRPETELMAENAIKICRGGVIPPLQGNRTPPAPPLVRGGEGGGRILDLCTGSGCLALALADAFPDAHVFGTDISEIALSYAEKNAQENKINNVSFVKGHLFEPLHGRDYPAPTFDLIISNPPYIRTDEIQTLQPEIRDWEPLSALDGGADGLNFYREIILQAGKFLKTNGILMLELGAGCANETVYMMKDAGFTGIELQKDYAGIERTIQGKWTN